MGGEWRPLPRDHAAYSVARRVTAAFAARNVTSLAVLTSLPLRVRYPRAYGDHGVVWELDEEAVDSTVRTRALVRLFRHFPRPAPGSEELDEARALGESRFIDMDPASTASTVRVHVYLDYNHLGDGVFDELMLSLARGESGAFRLRALEVGWFQRR